MQRRGDDLPVAQAIRQEQGAPRQGRFDGTDSEKFVVRGAHNDVTAEQPPKVVVPGLCKTPMHDVAREFALSALEYFGRILKVLTEYDNFERPAFVAQYEERVEEGIRVLIELPAVIPTNAQDATANCRRVRAGWKLGAEVHDLGLGGDAGRDVARHGVGHALQEARYGIEEFIAMKRTVEPDAIRGES